MICKNCGNQYPDGERFCPVCGAKAEIINTGYVNVTDSNSTYSLVFGILSLFLSGILGIIFAGIAISKANAFQKDNGMLCGNAQAGKIFGIIGLIIGILSILASLILVPLLAIGMSSAFTELLGEMPY